MNKREGKRKKQETKKNILAILIAFAIIGFFVLSYNIGYMEGEEDYKKACNNHTKGEYEEEQFIITKKNFSKIRNLNILDFNIIELSGKRLQVWIKTEFGWHSITAQKNGTEYSLYVDGKFVGNDNGIKSQEEYENCSVKECIDEESDYCDLDGCIDEMAKFHISEEDKRTMIIVNENGNKTLKQVNKKNQKMGKKETLKKIYETASNYEKQGENGVWNHNDIRVEYIKFLAKKHIK